MFEAGKRFTVPHLVESILLPSKQIAEPFRGTTITTKAGQVLTGLIVQESGKEVVLLLPDGTQKAMTKVEIEERTFAKISPMPAGVIRRPEELRDLLAYLLSAKPQPP